MVWKTLFLFLVHMRYLYSIHLLIKHCNIPTPSHTTHYIHTTQYPHIIIHHVPSKEQGHLHTTRTRTWTWTLSPTQSDYCSSGTGDTGRRFTRRPDYQLRIGTASTSEGYYHTTSSWRNLVRAQDRHSAAAADSPRASAHLQVLGFKDGPGLRVLVLAACCFLAYAFSPTLSRTPPPAWHARFSPDRFAYRSASTRRILHS